MPPHCETKCLSSYAASTVKNVRCDLICVLLKERTENCGLLLDALAPIFEEEVVMIR